GRVGGEASAEAAHRVLGRGGRDLNVEELRRDGAKLVGRAGGETIAANELDEGREHVDRELTAESQDVAVVVARDLVVPRAVEVAHALAFDVERLDGDRALLVLLAVTSACCIREVVGVRLDDHRPAETELLEDVLG